MYYIRHYDKAPIEYVERFMPSGIADINFYNLMNLNWIQHKDAPRMEYYCNDTRAPYTYGRGRGQRTYYPQPYVPSIRWIRGWCEQKYGCVFDVCFLNRYDTAKDALGWHSDDSPEMDPKRPVITVSLGAARDIYFRKIRDHSVKEGLTLAHGSMCAMLPGMQQDWEHKIPKASGQVGRRISLTFRGYTFA